MVSEVWERNRLIIQVSQSVLFWFVIDGSHIHKESEKDNNICTKIPTESTSQDCNTADLQFVSLEREVSVKLNSALYSPPTPLKEKTILHSVFRLFPFQKNKSFEYLTLFT